MSVSGSVLAARAAARGRRASGRRRLGLGLLLLVLLGLALWWLDLSQEVTPDDRAAIAEMLSRAGYPELAGFPRPVGFEAEVETVRAVQDAVLAAAPIDQGIPAGMEREPATLLRLGLGLCYDRSRTIEKSLRLFGLEIRHASLYGTAEQGALGALVTPGADSHALSEVRTARGWMTVDSNARWIGLTADGEPLALPEIDPARAAEVAPRFAQDPPTRLIVEPKVTLYGLYSRHGQFYPPFVPFPDLDLGQFVRYGIF